MSEERAAEREQPPLPAPPAETPAAKAAAVLVASEGGKKVVLWMTISALILALIAYAIGRLQTHARIAEAEAATQKAQAATQALEQQLALKDAMVRRLEARRLLGQAGTALEERNFGIADAALRASTDLLARSRQGSPPALIELEQEMVKFRTTATEDVGVQRARVLGWIKRFDRTVPPTAP